MLMSEAFSFAFLLLIVVLTYLANFFLHRMNTYPLLLEHEDRFPNSFIAQQAYRNLKTLNNFGPKVVGSNANEVLAANFILDYVNEVKRNATNPSDVIIDHQIVSGSTTTFGSMSYVNLQNIVVKLQGETDHALLINSHFDSVPGSPGGSDANVMICVMLEILRVLSRESKRQKHSIVFLFNGAEEVGLQAAHGFITQHPLKDDIRALINLESTGSDGREILFQSGPKHDWLIHMYNEAAPRPFAHVIAEELFASGVIPSATDFQIFRDYGNVPGVDFAYVENGWRYHTRYDSIDYLSLESVQHTGNNIISLTRKIANSNELANPPEGDNAVYFEYLGFFMISYTQSTGVIINWTVSILAFVIPFLYHAVSGDVWLTILQTITSFITFVVSIVLSALACYGLSTLMNYFDNTMSWYNTVFLSYGLYWSLAVIIQLLTYQIFQALFETCYKRAKKYRETPSSKKVQLTLNGVNLFWAIFTIGVTFLGFRLGYLPMILLFTSLVTFLIQILLKPLFPNQGWVIIHTIGNSFAFLFMSYLSIQIILLFIPIAGKQYDENPDIIIALICVLWTVLTLSYFTPLSQLTRYRSLIYSALAAFFVISLILSFTSIGYPYSDNQENPRLQRFRTVHIKRSLYDVNGNQLYSDNNCLLYGWDRNARRTLEGAFGRDNLQYWYGGPMCIYHNCGYPHYSGVSSAVTVRDFSDAPNIEPTKYTLTRVSLLPNSFYEVDFSLELKTVTHISFTPGNGVNFVNSTLKTQMYYDGSQLAQVTKGSKDNEVINIKAIFQGTLIDRLIATIGVVTIDSTFDQGPQTAAFKNVMNTFPDYTFSFVQQADSSFYEVRLAIQE